jgi:hypothetical protein
MAAIHESDMLGLCRDFPLELRRPGSSASLTGGANISSRLSGVIAMRLSDDVICPLMVDRHLVMPSRQITGSCMSSGLR